jgi:DNA polymerase III gamma/tau subunit
MATAGTHPTPTSTHPTPTKHPRAREERERARKSAAEHLQQASAEIDKARQEATADVRRRRDSALERMRDVSGELRQRAEDQTAEWQDALEHTSDTARRQMGRRVIRAQRTPEALKGRRRVPPGRPPSGCVECRIRSAADGPVAAAGEHATGRSRQSSLAALDVMVVDA